MDGKSFKISGNILNYFRVDRYGSFIPTAEKLLMSKVGEVFQRQMSANSGLHKRLANIYSRADVSSVDMPLGNTPVIGVGYKLFGPQPFEHKDRDETGAIPDHIKSAIDKRSKRIINFHESLVDVLEDCKPIEEDTAEKLLYDVESDQVNTGGGFDNNNVGEVHSSALHFINNSSKPIDYGDSALSELVVEASLWLKERLIEQGMKLGTLKPLGATEVRYLQDKDGMFGWPVYSQGNRPLEKDTALRLLIESGVDTSHLVDSVVVDKYTNVKYGFRVIDAGAYILDNKVFSYEELLSIVTLLVRRQKHGWKKDENGEFESKPGKTRSIYPNAFLPAIVEGMLIEAFNSAMKDNKVVFMPSLQTKGDRVSMIWQILDKAINNGYDLLAADWSKWDSGVKGSILATIIQLVVKPFFESKYYDWVDVVTYIITYKYLILDDGLANESPEAFAEALNSTKHVSSKGYTIFGLVDGLISGLKFTHVGGSLYGMVVVHYCIPKLLGYEPIMGCQAGDDTLMGIPIPLIDLSSMQKTYAPISDVANRFGLTLNPDKQIWHSSKGEIVKVFLQETYHYALNIRGVGSIFRPASAVLYTEYNKGLPLVLQLMAEIAKMNQGADSPFVEPVVRWWLSKEKFLAALFKESGISGFRKLIDTTGLSIKELAQSIDVGSFSFGVSKEDIESGDLEILPVMATVSASLDVGSASSVSKFLAELSESVIENTDSEDEILVDIDSDDI